MTGENQHLRERIENAVAAADIEYDRDATERDRIRSEKSIVDAVLAALGLLPAGHGWCPVHGDALCPEGYMLAADGTPRVGYQHYWSDELRCGKRQPTYRAAADSTRTGDTDGE